MNTESVLCLCVAYCRISKDQARAKLLEEKQRKLRNALRLAPKEDELGGEKPKPKHVKRRDVVPSSSDQEEAADSSSDSVSSPSSDSEDERKRNKPNPRRIKRRQRDASDERRPTSKRSRPAGERTESARHGAASRDRHHRERYSHSRRS